MSEAIYIVSGARTPMGGLMGDLAPANCATNLEVRLIKAAVERSGLDGDKVDEVFMGLCSACRAQAMPSPTSEPICWPTRSRWRSDRQQSLWQRHASNNIWHRQYSRRHK